ncbi:hypothetical protein, partial [Streptomyces pratensis]|uniref:hypothetical protein n=1 Tax=Streptomyces pratensis TaxID=1169025 RepID=UPI003629A2DC
MRTRKISVLTMTAVALGLALTACDNGGGDNASSSARSSTVASTPQSDTAEGKSSGTPAESGAKCTDQVDYAGDSRSNAEINSIGEDTGTCPPVQKSGEASGTPKDPGAKCTDQVDYAGDSRSNAEINSIG